MQSDTNSRTFRRMVVPPSSGLKSKPKKATRMRQAASKANRLKEIASFSLARIKSYGLHSMHYVIIITNCFRYLYDIL
jgi:hypothetical protein